METSNFGLELLKKHEGFVPYWYDDFDTSFPRKELKNKALAQGTPTIGYGFTEKIIPFSSGQKMSQYDGIQLLKRKLPVYENAVKKAVKVPVTQKQFDALVSFTYNTGAFKSDLFNHINSKNKDAVETFWRNKYITSKGRLLAGLVKRRADEAQIFISEWDKEPKYNVASTGVGNLYVVVLPIFVILVLAALLAKKITP